MSCGHGPTDVSTEFSVDALCCCAQLSILLCLVDIAAGMSYLHSIGLLHSDLKGGNVLLKSCAPTKSDPRGFVCKVWSIPVRHSCTISPQLLPWFHKVCGALMKMLVQISLIVELGSVAHVLC